MGSFVRSTGFSPLLFAVLQALATFLLLATEANAQQVVMLEELLAQGEPTADELVDELETDSAEPVTITEILLEETVTGFTLQLVTSNAITVSDSVSQDNSTVISLENAVLRLADDEEFAIANPAPSIEQVSVVELPDNEIQIVVTGVDAPPAIDIQPEDIQSDSVRIGVRAGAGETLAQVQADESINMVVTGERDTSEDYYIPSSSTGTRFNAPILDTPASIQVVPRQVLEDQQVTRLDEALNNVSGVTFGGTFGNASLNFNARGFDAPTLRDGFQEFGGFTGINPAITNLERVEVLKGPASILYGEVQPGGVINLVTEAPLSEPTYAFGTQVGNREFVQPQIDFSGPLTADGILLYRLNASFLNDDGFTDFNQDFERFFVAPVLSWQIGEQTDLTIRAEYTDERIPFDNGLVASGDGVVDVPFNQIVGEPDDFIDNTLLRLGYDFEHRFNESWRIKNAFEFSDRSQLFLGFLPFIFDESSGLVSRFAGQSDFDIQNYSLQTSIVGEVSTGPIDHTFLLGFDLNRTDDRNIGGVDSTPFLLDIFNPVFGLTPNVGDLEDIVPISFDEFIQSNRLGIFIQDQLKFSDSIILVAGIRYDGVNQTITNNPTEFDPIGSESSQNVEEFSPRVGIVYKPVEFVSLFASYSQSFSPSFDTDSSGDLLEPELGEGFDIGIKTELLDGDLLATLTYFDVAKENVAAPDPIDLFSSIAAGEQRSRGIEFDVSGELLPGWKTIASYTYIDSEITEDTVNEGNRLFNTPEHSASLWTTYEIQSGNFQGLGFGGGFTFIGEREGDLANSFSLDSYILTNASIFYRRENIRLALNAKNIFDVDYIAASNNSRTNGVEPGAPFTILGTIDIEF